MDNFTQFLSSNKSVFTWISVAIGLPSTLLYCAEIWTILWHKPFHNSFYTFFVVRASTDILYTFLSFFYVRMTTLFPEWFLSLELTSWQISFWSFCSGYTFVSDNLAMTFILVNRFTAIARPTKHENIWRKFMPLVLLIVYGVPLFNIRIFWINEEALAERDGHGRILSVYYQEKNNGTTKNDYIVFNTFLSVLFLTFCIPVNMAVLWAYRKYGKQQQPVGPQNQNQDTIGQQRMNAAAKAKMVLIQRRLLLFAVITFIGHVLIAIWLITLCLGFAIGNVFLITLVLSQFSLVVDFGLVVIPSWMLLWASASFRRQFMATFLPNALNKKLFGTVHLNTIKVQDAVIAAAKPIQFS